MIMYDMVYMNFYARRMGMLISLNETKHVYIAKTGLHLGILFLQFLS
jgi:hypothetical protein